MSKAKKLALSALALLALVAGGAAYQHHKEGQPYLKGHCFADANKPAMLAVVDSKKLKDQAGNDVEAYLTMLVLVSPMGEITLNGPALEVREANRELRKAVKEGKLKELDCETGEEIK